MDSRAFEALVDGLKDTHRHIEAMHREVCSDHILSEARERAKMFTEAIKNFNQPIFISNYDPNRK